VTDSDLLKHLFVVFVGNHNLVILLGLVEADNQLVQFFLRHGMDNWFDLAPRFCNQIGHIAGQQIRIGSGQVCVGPVLQMLYTSVDVPECGLHHLTLFPCFECRIHGKLCRILGKQFYGRSCVALSLCVIKFIWVLRLNDFALIWRHSAAWQVHQLILLMRRAECTS
jgi:hypothetical protein